MPSSSCRSNLSSTPHRRRLIPFRIMLIVEEAVAKGADCIKDDPVYGATLTTASRTEYNPADKKDRRFKKRHRNVIKLDTFKSAKALLLPTHKPEIKATTSHRKRKY